MLLNEYQERAIVTAKMAYGGLPREAYFALKLNGEAGEVAEKIGKIFRDKDGVISEADRYEIAKELGDVLWYIAALAEQMEYSLAAIADLNLNKIADRIARGVQFGNGDNR